ncbi:hypothetical protein Pcinc_028323 [Petrolisthes cinctipes]|uniref:THAP-type domain-containing protein n=1 Tax=Petrolisthes cinctipes TaxID=88211 RepID=A0AAE1K9H7_PETCI|nr:hypothetical protein Pcinc_028323 [Petrolisthes cinctipes]
MPNHVCAVADCKSDARRHSMHAVQGTIKGWARYPPPIKEPKRWKLWEDRCRRPAGWRATRNHYISSLHFINWGENKPSQKHPDPELFAYNGWGKNCPKVLKRNKNVLQVQAQSHEVPDEPQEFSNGSSTSTKTQRSGDSSHTEEVYVFRGVQDWSEVEIGLNDTTKNVTEQCSSLSTSTVVGETYHSASDHTYASFTDSGGATVDPSDVGVQTDDFEIPTPEVAAAVDADIKGTLRQAFINRVLRSDTSVKKFTGMLSREYLDTVFKMIDKSVTSQAFSRVTNFPPVIEAIDGTHVAIKAPSIDEAIFPGSTYDAYI